MISIGIIANEEKDVGFKYTNILANSILSRGGRIQISSTAADALNVKTVDMAIHSTDSEVIGQSDIVICLGGDGTFIKTARMTHSRQIPILGINLGTLGFLTEVEKGEIDSAVEHIIRNEYDIEERMVLEASIIRDDIVIASDMALNDVVVSKGALSRILHLKTYINNVFVDFFPGDGLILSSPTGSTAYSLSAGGPIVEPDIDLIIITPICPHILYSRSFITTGNRVVKVTVDENYRHGAMVTVDGQKGYEVRGGDSIEIKKSGSFVKMIRLNTRNFFSVLRSKIYDRGENLRKDEV